MGGQTTGIGVGVSQGASREHSVSTLGCKQDGTNVNGIPGGFGGAKDASASTSGKQERRAEGYGGSQDMDRNVGA